MRTFILLLGILISNLFLSQEKSNIQYITGIVFEIVNQDSLSPLPGVNVRFSLSTYGTASDKNGYFKLPYYPSDQQLIFSYTGYQTDTLEIKNNKVLKVVMSEGKILEDLVVEFKKGSYSFSKIDPRNAHIIGQDELRKAACCNLAESFETNPSIDATFTDAVTGTKQIQMMGLSGKYVQMLSGNIPIIRGISILNGLKTSTFLNKVLR